MLKRPATGVVGVAQCHESCERPEGEAVMHDHVARTSRVPGGVAFTAAPAVTILGGPDTYGS